MSNLGGKQAITCSTNCPCLNNDTLWLTTACVPSISAAANYSLYGLIQSYFHCPVGCHLCCPTYVATPAGVIAGVVVGVFLAFVLIFVVAVIVAAVVLVHRRKSVPSMCLNIHVINAVELVVPCTCTVLVVQVPKLQHPRHPIGGKHCSVQCSPSAVTDSV